MACKTDDQSSQKWPASVCSSTASLDKNGFGLASLQHKSTLTVLMASNMPSFYRSKVGYPSPTSSQNPGSKNAQYLPNMAKIHYYRHKNQTKIHKLYNKNHFSFNMGIIPLYLARAPKCLVTCIDVAKRQPIGLCAGPLSRTIWSHVVMV
jgi:hypothetical protein